MTGGGTVFVSSAMIRGGKLPGEPPTQGDHFTDPRTGRIIDQKKRRLDAWRVAIAYTVRTDPGWVPIPDGPICCTLTFILPRPKSHYRTGRFAGVLRDDAPLLHSSKPDVDKLQRAVLDALSMSGAWGDDAQVAIVTAAKRYVMLGEPGVEITCAPLLDDGSAA